MSDGFVNRPNATISGIKIKAVYGPSDRAGADYDRDLGRPGELPLTRGIHPEMYRKRLWTMRLFSGFATPEETNERYKYLLGQGQTGLSVAFDMPTLMGYDSDHERALGEVGKCGVAVCTLGDMKRLFQDIPMDKVTTSMTVNGPAAILFAFFAAAAKAQGADLKRVGGTIQNDILKEYMAQNTWVFPPEPSLRLITDMFAFCAEEMPRWNTISISGYHIREAGATAAQELAFTLYNGLTYIERGVAAGLDVDAFAPRLSFFFDAHIDFFEEIAKLRAARRIWAREVRKRFDPKDPRSWTLRFHTQTAGCSLTHQEPENNIVRTAFEALAAVLGGAQSLHTNSMDEVHGLPTEGAALIALRTQQIVALETEVTQTVDPLAGSYFLESLTDEIERLAYGYFHKIEEMGGVLAGIERGFFQQEIARSAYEYQRALEKQEKFIVGVNVHQPDETPEIEILRIDEEIERKQVERVKAFKAARDENAVAAALHRVERTAKSDANMYPPLIAAAEAGASLGEIVDALKKVFGAYKDVAVM